MFELDDKFFEEIGINKLPAEEMGAFKKHVQEEVELRVGERISDGITPEIMKEFEFLVDDIPGYLQKWLEKYSPDYENDDLYIALKNQLSEEGNSDTEVLPEFAAMKWLQINRPDFTQIIAEVMSEMQNELKTSSDKIQG